MVLCACGGTSAHAPTRDLAPELPPPLASLEQRLLSAHSFHIRARLASGGRIESHFEGTLVAGEGQRMHLALEGSFGGRDASAQLVCDGSKMRGGSREQPFTFDAPPALREGVVVGFVRMGLLHNVAGLANGKPPDHVDGKARLWLDVVGADHGPGETVRGAATERWTWALYADHKRAADETLWLDAQTGLPLRRRVTVHFAEGDMDVGEEYDEFAIDEPEDDETFRVVE
jgi:hypothetical protein